jgi:hypothetical protein
MAYFNAIQAAAGDSALDFIKWKTKQIEEAESKTKPPTPSEIVTTIPKTNFALNTSIGVLCSLLWADSAPDIPLAASSKFKTSLRPSTTVLQVSLPQLPDPSGPRSATDDMPGEVDYAAFKPPTFNRYLVALTPTLPTSGKAPEPPSIALQLGTLISTIAITPKPEDWSETDFIVVLNALDLSLWIAYNYTPYDELDQLAPIPIPKTIDPASPPGGTLPGLTDDTRFDVAMLLNGDAVRKWDPTKVGTAEDLLKTIVATRSTRGLVAKTIEEADVAKAFVGKVTLGEGSGPVPPSAATAA